MDLLEEDGGAALFEGEPLDPETKELLRQSLKNRLGNDKAPGQTKIHPHGGHGPTAITRGGRKRSRADGGYGAGIGTAEHLGLRPLGRTAVTRGGRGRSLANGGMALELERQSIWAAPDTAVRPCGRLCRERERRDLMLLRVKRAMERSGSYLAGLAGLGLLFALSSIAASLGMGYLSGRAAQMPLGRLGAAALGLLCLFAVECGLEWGYYALRGRFLAGAANACSSAAWAAWPGLPCPGSRGKIPARSSASCKMNCRPRRNGCARPCRIPCCRPCGCCCLPG